MTTPTPKIKFDISAIPLEQTTKALTKRARAKLRQQKAIKNQLAVLESDSTVVAKILELPNSFVRAETNKSREALRALSNLADDLYNLEPEFMQYQVLYCAKTGQPIANANISMLAQTIQTHGRKRAHTLLRYAQLGHVHPNWIDTSPKCRDKLLSQDPIGFFVFAAKNLLAKQWEVPTSFNPTADVALQLRWDKADQLRALYANFASYADSSCPELALEQLTTLNRRLVRFLGLVKANPNEISNAGRRVYKLASDLIGSCCYRTELLAVPDKPHELVSGLVIQLTQDLTESIETVMKRWAKENLGVLAERNRPRLNPKQLEWMRADMGGSSAFARQSELEKQTNEFLGAIAGLDLGIEPKSKEQKQKKADNKFLRRAIKARTKTRTRTKSSVNFSLDGLDIGIPPTIHKNKRIFEGVASDAKTIKFEFELSTTKETETKK